MSFFSFNPLITFLNNLTITKNQDTTPKNTNIDNIINLNILICWFTDISP